MFKHRKSTRRQIRLVRRIKSQSIQVSGGHRLASSIKLVPNTIHLDHATKTIVDRKRAKGPFGLKKKQKIARFQDIQEIIVGMKTERFLKLKQMINDGHHFAVSDNMCLSISLANSIKTIDLVAINHITRDKWHRLLINLIKVNKHKHLEENFHSFLRENFNKADLDKNKALSFKEILRLLQSLNISFDKHEAKVLFEKANFRKNTNENEEETLDIDEFIKFYGMLSYSRVMIKHFCKHARNGNFMESKELHEFMVKVQKSPDITEAQCLDLITAFEPLEADTNPRTWKREHILTAKGFRNMLASSQFSIYPSRLQQVNQDMTRPLVDYFISTSHNTYLYDDQIEGESTTETFRLYLLQGCRSVELDITDGDEKTDFEPAVTHKNSFTSKAKLSAFVSTIREFAFTQSPYPIIISMENNFKELNSQRDAARIFREGFGEHLISSPLDPNETTFPSPEQLHHKIILKGKKIAAQSTKSIEELEKEMNLAKELSDLVWYGQSKHLKTFAETGKWNYTEMASIEEKKSTKYSRQCLSEYVSFTSRHLTKVYPNGLRLLSSNYDPLPHWFCGAQMVALNHQTHTNPMLLNRALFHTNGSCGYVLKPQFQPKSNYRRCYLLINILSAIHLPEIKDGLAVNPMVELRLFGVNTYYRQHFRTGTIKDNGFNPEWNARFRFKIPALNLPLTFIRFRVMERKLLGKDALVAQQMLSVEHMAEGYRSISMLDCNNSSLELTKLFVKVEKRFV